MNISLFDTHNHPRSTICFDPDGIPLPVTTMYLSSLERLPRNSLLTRFQGVLRLYQFLTVEEGLTLTQVENRMLTGEPLEDGLLHTFSHHLEEEITGYDKQLTQAQIRTINKRLSSAGLFERWCLKRFSSNVWQSSTLMMRQKAWEEVSLKGSSQHFAEDYTDDEIVEIDTVLRQQHTQFPQDLTSANGFLMWRFAIEYGLRIGEILSLRIEDLPSAGQPYLRIVRNDDRHNDNDPRGKNKPSPKTLGRDLGYWFTNSAFPHLFENYRQNHRTIWITGVKTGKRQRSPILPHPYLLISNTGQPLSISSSQYIAKHIERETGIPFNWHKARHSFFNRAYLAMLQLPGDEQARARDDLRYWGGWSQESSLDIYTQTARRARARQAAFTFSSHGQSYEWGLLS